MEVNDDILKWIDVIIFVIIFIAGYIFGYNQAKPKNIYANPNFCATATATETDATEEESTIEEIEIPSTVAEHIKEYKIKAMYKKNNSYYAKEPVKIEPTRAKEKVVSPLVEQNNVSAGPGFVGTYQLTAYTHTGNPMANGQMPYVGAVACNSLPIGTVVYIEGYGNFVVCDRGGMGGSVIDIFMNTYDECIQFGRRSANVYIVN